MKGIKRGIGLKFAMNGIKEAFVRERNFRIHLVIATIVICCGLIIKLSIYEWITIIIAIFIVLLAELVNSVIERLIDYLKPEIHSDAKIIKDIGAGIVLVAALTSIVLGLLVFLPKVF